MAWESGLEFGALRFGRIFKGRKRADDKGSSIRLQGCVNL